MVSVETVCGSTEFVCCFQESLGNYEDVTKVFLIQHLGGPNCLHPILTRHPLKWTKMDILHTKVCTLKNNTNLNPIFCLVKSSKNDFIFSSALHLIIWVVISTKKF